MSLLTDIIKNQQETIEYLRQQLATLATQCEKIIRWKHMMSYNDSYFCEPVGDLKRAAYEIDRALATTEQKEQEK